MEVLSSNTEEVWKNVDGFSNYFISSKGRVKSVFGKNRKLFTNHKGYYYIGIRDDNGVRKSPFVHRLVAVAFIPNPSNLPQVNHKDGNKENNCVENLEWITNRDNLKHAFDIGLRNNRGENNPRSKIKITDIPTIKELHKQGKMIKDIAKMYGVGATCISEIINGISWKGVNYEDKS